MAIRSKTAAVLALGIAATMLLEARPASIKIGTIAPDHSAYVNALREMAAACQQRTAGRVTYVVFPGTVGSEEKILRDMRGSAHTPQAAQLSAITLGRLDTAFNVFGVPMFFESYAEAERVLDTLTPLLDARLATYGLKTLNLAWVGWVHVFSKQPVTSVADLKKQRLYTSAGDETMTKWYSANGFNVVPLDATQMLAALQTNQIQAVPGPPIFAQTLHWFDAAPFMMELGFAPLLGATVLSVQTWNGLSAEDQHVVMEEAQRAGARLRRDVPGLERRAIDEMRKRGLTVTTVQNAEWRLEAAKLAKAMREAGLVPDDVHEIARREIDALRAGR